MRSPSPSLKAQGALVALLAFAAYANTLGSAELVRDDVPLIADNQLLRGWGSLPRLLSTGYWDGALGLDAPAQEYRPVLMLSHFLTRRAAGLRPWAHHLVNVLLHSAVCALLLLVLASDLPPRTAFAAASIFAVLPAGSEAVGYVSGRSETLALLFLLGAWLLLARERPRSTGGLACFALALLSKEQAVVFPLLLALHDFVRRRPARPRAPLYAGLALVLAAYLGLRWAVLSHGLRVGSDYFAGKPYPVRLLTMAAFAWRWYLLPLVSGAGTVFDFAPPFFPDASPGDPRAWLALAGLAAVLAWAARSAWKERSVLGFWTLAAALYLAPVSNLLVPLDELGAPRFLYFPSIAFCVLAADALRRLPRPAARAALAALLGWYASRTLLLNRLWHDAGAYHEAALRANPHSQGYCALGLRELDAGRADKAEALFREAIARHPSNPMGWYDLGKLLWDRGRRAEAEEYLREAALRAPRDPDILVFLGAAAEGSGRWGEALARYGEALRARPWDPRAHFNSARILWAAGRRREGGAHFEEFLRLAPDDPDAETVRRMLAESRAGG